MRPSLARSRSALLLTVFGALHFAAPASAQSVPAAPSVQSIPATPPKASAAATPATPAMGRDAVLTRGRQLVTWFYAQDLDPVWAAFLPSARANFGSDLSAFKAYRSSGVTTYGKETRLLSEDVQTMDGVTYYLRTATFEKGPRVQWTVAFGLDAAGRVVEFGILGGTEAAPDQQARGRNGGSFGF